MSKLQEFLIFLTLCVTLHEIKICFFDLKIIELVKINTFNACKGTHILKKFILFSFFIISKNTLFW